MKASGMLLLIWLAFLLPCRVLAFDIILPPIFSCESDLSTPRLEQSSLALGPIVEYQRLGGERMAAFRPLWSRQDKADNWHATDILWPLFVYRDLPFEEYWRFLLMYRGERKDRDTDFDHFGIIPLWFHGRDDNDEFYWAFVPLYGQTRYFLSYDRINFILAPCYVRTERRDEYGEAYLWPIINWDSGTNFDKLRVFPFYAYHHRFGQFYRESYLWPLLHFSESRHPEVPGGGWMFWPLLGHGRWKDRDSWSFVWPLFQYDRRGEAWGLRCPWPIFQYQAGIELEREEHYRLYFWPIWGRRIRERDDYMFFIWPLGTWLDWHDNGRIRWIYALPLFWGKDAWDADGGKRETYRRFWPLASYYNSGESCEFRILDWWPERNMPVIERNWNPLWMPYLYRANADGFRHELLWRLLIYSGSESRGRRLAVFPFYDVHYNLGNTDNGEFPGGVETVRDFLFGIIRQTRLDAGENEWRFLWFINF